MAYSEVRCDFAKLFIMIMDSSVGGVATSSKSILFPLCAGLNPVTTFIFFRHFYFILFSYVPFNHVCTKNLTSIQRVP